MAINQQDKRPPYFHKAKQRVIEEVAFQILTSLICEEGDIDLPESWYKQAHELKDQILRLIEQEKLSRVK